MHVVLLLNDKHLEIIQMKLSLDFVCVQFL